MTNSKKILITSAGSALGEGLAIGLARLGYKIIAGVQISSHASDLSKKAADLAITDNLLVEKLDILNPLDINHALQWDIDILVNNSEAGQAGPAFEIPLDLVRANYELNVFAPLQLSQKFINKWIKESKKGKIIFISPLCGILSAPGACGIYPSTKNAVESIAEALKDELRQYGIKIQTIDTGGWPAGDPRHKIEKKMQLPALNPFSQSPSDLYQTNFDLQELIGHIIEIVPQQNGRFKNVVPQYMQDLQREHQIHSWNAPM